jgi:hypothetical protein
VLPYWFLFLAPAILAVAEKETNNQYRVDLSRSGSQKLAWTLIWLILTLVIGFRFRVGGDWYNYFHYLYEAEDVGLGELLSEPEPGYRLFNWMSDNLGWSIYGVNLFGGALFAFGLVGLCLNQPRPWLALTVSVPYLVIVVAMGYSRQGIALGVVMMGVLALERGSIVKFVLYVAVAATFHKSAVLLIPIAALASTTKKIFTFFWVAIAVLVLYYLMLSSQMDELYDSYIESQYQSQGALIRLVMNALAAVVFLIWRRNLEFNDAQMRLWFWFSVLSLFFLALFTVTKASTALDRVALYFLPLQIVVFARAPSVVLSRKASQAPRPLARTDASQLMAVLVIIYYAGVQYTWLNFANNANHWVPYQFYLTIAPGTE